MALRLCFERLLPVRKDHPISLQLKKLEKLEDASLALGLGIHYDGSLGDLGFG